MPDEYAVPELEVRLLADEPLFVILGIPSRYHPPVNVNATNWYSVCAAALEVPA